MLLIGGSGFIGRNFILARRGKTDIVATYNGDEGFPSFISEHRLKRVTPFKCDLRREKMVKRLVEENGYFDRCVYLASDTRVGYLATDSPTDVTNNILPVANFVKYYEGGPVVYFSSGAVYTGNRGLVSPRTKLHPRIPYAISKLTAELYVQHHGRSNAEGYVVVRFFGAYGRFEAERKLTRKILLRILETETNEFSFTIYGDGNNLIDVMYVDDVVRAIDKVLISGQENVVVDLCAGSPLTINQYVLNIAEMFGKEVLLSHKGTSPEYIRAFASTEDFSKRFDFVTKIRLQEGIRRYMSWLRSNVVPNRFSARSNQ